MARCRRREHGPTRLSVSVPAVVTAAMAYDLHRAHRRYISRVREPGPIDLVAPAPSSVPADARPVELLMLGDSGMAGVGVARPRDTLNGQIALRVARITERPVHAVSHARAGARTRDVQVHQLLAGQSAPDVVVLLVGTNDVLRLTPLHRLATDSTNLLEALARLGSPVVMSSLPEFGAMRAVPGLLRAALAARAVAVRRLQAQSAREGRVAVDLVDVRLFVGQEFLVHPALMSSDRFHPSARGYALIADVLAPTVAARVPAAAGCGSQDATGLVPSGSAS